ncbi:putative membrane protein [Sphingomonas sp. BK345]|nr:putative membrane protein [Sphingomonas sp. BK345]
MMSLRTTILAATAVLALGACSRGNDTTQAGAANGSDLGATGMATATPTAAAPAAAGQSFANTAAASDAFEIETSRLALTNASSPAVKRFAKAMIDAHEASTAKLKTVTAGLSPAIQPVATLSAEQQQTVESLRAAKGSAFDSAYAAAQSAAHQQTLDVLKAYAASGDVPALKTFAQDLVPTVTAHLNMAKGLKV